MKYTITYDRHRTGDRATGDFLDDPGLQKWQIQNVVEKAEQQSVTLIKIQDESAVIYDISVAG